MREAFLERRRGPRVTLSHDGVRSERALAMSVRLLDIGMNGVLLASSHPFEVGQHARMSTRLGNCTIDADVVVRRVSHVGGDQGYRIGARFVSLDEATRLAMQQFVAAGGDGR